MSKKPENPPDPSELPEYPELSEEGETLIYSGDMAGFGDGSTEFDYASFDMDLDRLEAEEGRQRDEQQQAQKQADIQKRPTFAKRVNTQDATASVRPAGQYNVVSFQGRINESFDAAAHASLLRGSVIFDLSDVDRITSFGVRGWLQMLQMSTMEEAIFIRCSEHVVNQITMIRNFCGIARIYSIHAPYLCDACGAEFNVPINAIEDRELLVGRRAPKVACPECNATTELDEDPWEFFSLDDHLMEGPLSIEFTQAISYISNESRHPAVEKVFIGTDTRIRFNGDLDEATRFKRAFSGIEGDVILDFSHVDSVSPEAVEKLASWVVRASADTSSIVLEGAPLDLCDKLLRLRAQSYVKVRSITTEATNVSGIHRSCLIDLGLNRRALLEHRAPMVDANWAQSGIELDDPDLVAEVVEAFAERADETQTHTMPSQHSAPASLHSMPAPSIAPSFTSIPAPSVAAAVEQEEGGKTIMIAAFVLALASLFMVLLAVTFIALSQRKPVAETAPVTPPVEEVVQPKKLVSEGLWSTGEEAPPAWSANAMMQTDTDFLFVGKGEAVKLDGATSKSKESATALLLRYLQQQIASGPAGPGLNQFAVPASESTALAAYEANTKNKLLMIVNESVHQTKGGKTTVYQQFSVSKASVSQLVALYTTVYEFKGVKVAQMPPWKAGVRVIEVPTWYDIPVGATLVSVGDQRLTTASEWPDVAALAFNLVGEGQELKAVFTKDGKEYVARFRKNKRSAQPAAKPSGGRPKLLGLDQ